MVADDHTPTNPQSIDVLAAQIDGLRRDPGDRELFEELYTALREAGNPAPLAEVCELHAPTEKDVHRAAQYWADAGEARYHLTDPERGEHDLRQAIALDPANERAVSRLTEQYMVGSRWAEAAEVMEAELATLTARLGGDGGRAFASRRAARHRMLGQLWEKHLGRVDQALMHWQKAWQLEPEVTDALEAARVIYTSLGDDKMVARLYELELESLGTSRPDDASKGGPAVKRARRAWLERQLGELAARAGDHAAAIAHLERALRLAPEDQGIKEMLAERYASQPWPTDEARAAAPAGSPAPDAAFTRAVELYLDLGRAHAGAGDLEGAISFQRRALGVNPRSEAAVHALARSLTDLKRWAELERLYRQRAPFAIDDEETASLLALRAELLETRLDQPQGAKQALEALASRQPPGGVAAHKLRVLYAKDGDWAEWAALVERELENPALENISRVADLLQLAQIARDHLQDRDRAAECLHRVLTLEPNHPEALARYADHFREKRDWRGLADLAEFAVEAAREAQLPAEELARRLEELAQVSELRLGDVERAISAWRRLEELDPQNTKAKEAIRRLLSRTKMWESLVAVLEKEATAATGPRERAEALKRIAQVFRERQVDPRRAIALYESALELEPGDPPTLKALADLYEREGDDAGVCRTLRRQLDADAERVMAEARRDGKRALTAKEWPTALRVERLTTLRRLAAMYENRLGDVEGVVWAGTAILELMPGDRDALERLERTLERAGEAERLEQTLEYHAEAATGPAERAKVLRRLARLAALREDDVAAVERWERLMRAAPNDGEALRALAELYERIGRFAEMAAVLDRALSLEKPPEAGSPAAAARAFELQRLARTVDGKLNDSARAVKAWRQVIEILPYDREALKALTRLYEGASMWRDLCDVLARQAPLYTADDRAAAAQVAFERARILEEKLASPKDAALALEALIKDIDPRHQDAHSTLRRLYEARGDFQAAVRVAERELYLAEHPLVKVARGLEIGLLCRDRLHDARRALQAFERVLSLEPGHPEALQAASELYARVGDWARHVRALERLAEHAPEGRERRTLYLRIAHAVAEKLADPKAAFAWFRRAHEHAPDDATLTELRRAAETHGLWNELAEVWEGERERATTPPLRVAAGRELAAIVERRLGDRDRALTVLAAAVAAMPEDDTLVAEAERVAGEAGPGPAPWQALLEIYATALARRAGTDARVALHDKRARVREERLADAKGALDELMAAFALAPEREATRDGILRLAEKARRWDDALAVEAALLARAPDPGARLAIARRTAVLIEEKVGERTRAFRAWLRAMTLAPEDPDVTANLWRLARVIGSYREGEKQATPEPGPAPVSAAPPGERNRRATPPPMPDTAAPAGVAMFIESSKPRREHTQEISVSDLIIESQRVKLRGDATIPLELGDLADLMGGPGATPVDGIPVVQAQKPARTDSTIELKTEDLIQALSSGAGRPPPSPPAELSAGEPRRPGEPPAPGRRTAPLPGGSLTPPRLPGIHAKPKPAPVARPAARPAGPRAVDLAVAALAALPRSLAPDRKYETPWEELAAAVEAVPSGDTKERLANLFRASEIWERGAADIDRAFDALARALLIAPEDPETRQRLGRLAEDHQAWPRLVVLYDEAADRASSADTAASLLFEVASVHGRHDAPLEAETVLRRVLGMRPDDARARTELENLLEAQSRWVDLAAVLEERTDPRLGSAAPEPERPAFLVKLAAIYDEKLGKPYEAITALERLRELLHDAPDTLDALATLYTKVGRWAKVVEALSRLAELVDGTDRAREARRRVAEIYQHELELPERAIEAYEHLVTGWPDDASALEAQGQLLEAVGRWADLAEVLRRRATLATDPPARAGLLRRRAQILLEWLNQPDEAVACLRHARTITPNDASLAEDMVIALSKSGRAREAAAVLEGRVATLEAEGAAPGDVAALLLRLATLRAEQLDDREGARRVLEKVLTRVPDHPSALAALARLARGGADPRAYAQARLREAGAAVDRGERVAALIEAGTTLRDKVGDAEGARAAFAQVLEVEPANPEATWALAALAAGGGDLDLAVGLLEGRLTEDLPAEEHARVRTELAALSLRAGVPAAASRHLDEALRAKPDHVPAVIALADLYLSAGNFAELEAFLREALPVLSATPAALRAELERRLAEACEKLGRDDEAYQLLLEADKLHRNDLLIKLALGENRYRARRWREAALHLGSLGDHPEAPTRAAEVADGLYHAALAEIRSLRPERAQAHYEKALVLKPEHTQSLHALAEIEIERGNVERAADLLERQAAATPDHAERLRLFEALGDLALRALDDRARARQCFEAAVTAAAPLEQRHLPLLEKLRECQMAIGEFLRAGLTCELMASFGTDASTRAGRLREAAECYLAARDPARARLCAERALEADPLDEQAIWTASQLALEADDPDGAASLLGRALGTLPPPAPEHAPRRAELWRRLGDARRGRGDPRGAVQAYEKAITLHATPETESDASLEARRALVELLAVGEADRREDIRGHLRALVYADQKPEEVLALGRALAFETTAGPVDEDGGRVVLELAAALGQPLGDADKDWLARHPVRPMAVDQSYVGAIDEADRSALIVDAEDWPLTEALAAVWEAAPVLWPDPTRALESAAAERVPPAAQGDAAAIYPQVARALAAPATVLWVTAAPAAPDVSLACASPPLVLLGPRVLLYRPDRAATSVGEALSPTELRFVLGRAVELARPERVPAVGLPRAAFSRLVAGLVRAYGGRPEFCPEGVTPEEADAEAERLRKALTLKARLRIEPALQKASLLKLDPGAYRAACERAADRAGLIVSGDVRAAVRMVGGAARAGHLVRLATEPRFLTVRAKLGIGAG